MQSHGLTWIGKVRKDQNLLLENFSNVPTGSRNAASFEEVGCNMISLCWLVLGYLMPCSFDGSKCESVKYFNITSNFDVVRQIVGPPLLGDRSGQLRKTELRVCMRHRRNIHIYRNESDGPSNRALLPPE